MKPSEERTGIEPFFLEGGDGARFCVLHRPPPAVPVRGALVYLHPFAEEMNKSRRTAALAARAFATCGWAVLQIDLKGCGDSDGELRDVSWQDWKEDARNAISRLQNDYARPIGLWGLRLGALLACDVACDLAASDAPVLLWNPIPSGKAFLTQFLRIAVAGAAFGRQDAARGTGSLAARLVAGETIEVGGYEIGPTLSADLGRLQLAECRPGPAGVIWCEVSAAEPAETSPAGRAVVERWRAAGSHVTVLTVTGEPFWATLEIAEGRALVGATIAALESELTASGVAA